MDAFTISFEHKGIQHQLEAKFMRVGYVHQFHINFENRTLIFEFDEEREYRIIDADSSSTLHSLDKELLAAMANAISALH